MTNDDHVRSLRMALQSSPDNMVLRQHLAQLLLSMGEFDAAATEFKTALALCPDDYDLKFGLVRSWAQQGQDAKALALLEELVAADPEFTEALALHAKLLLRNGDNTRAIAQFRQALMQDETLKASELGEQLAEQLGVLADGGDALSVDWDDDEDEDDETYSMERRPSITFEAVGGMEALKEEIRLKIIYPLTHADMYKAYGKSIGGGILMYGPPGCGKTHLARATAGEIRASFIAVSISDILDMWLGSSERNLHDLFAQARRNAPCVLFFDEVDALASRRSDMLSSAGRHVINQFLTELDGVKHSNEGVLILAATNAPWYLDSAFRRPGRFDRILFVQPPDQAGRCAILRLLCKGKPVEDIDFSLLGKKTHRFSGADLKAVVDRAVEEKLKEAMKTGMPKPLGTKDLLRAARTVTPSTREWFGTARNYATHANQDGTYDDILTYLNE
ncbi:MAG: AAA family ATPase [Phormidesmis sp. RL_2_1]|nr:AAA family ATPase [Phormidesmis sp. RL_2_1]